MRDYLNQAVEKGASDLHIIAGLPPVLRVNGDIIIADAEPLGPDATEALILASLTPEQRATFEATHQLCTSMTIADLGYFRMSVYKGQGTVGAAIRVGALAVRRLEELGLPPIASELTRRPAGLILITGPTGSGKTTTLNAMIDQINRERRCKIITVEDPIEFVHTNKRSVVVQQEVYTDAPSFSGALVHILRQDPDVIGIGEMRDLETMATALTAAETGHLVLSTLHTPDAPLTVNRIIDVFPSGHQNQVRMQLAASLEAVIAQQLLPRVDTEGRVLATEVLVATPAVRNIIRENKITSLASVMQTGHASGMHTMDACLRDLYQRGIITYDTALSRLSHPENLRPTDAAATGADGAAVAVAARASAGRNWRGL